MHDSANAGRRSIAILAHWGPVGRVAGCSFPMRPLRKARPAIPARTGSKFPNGAPRGNCDPEFELETVPRFPNRPVPETISRNPRSNWDAVSQGGLFWKLRPTLKDKTGTQFPGRASKTKLRWNSSCLGLQPTKTGTIPPQLMRGWENARAGNRSHLRGLGGRSQRHVIETHTSYGLPNSTDTRYPAGLPSNEARRSPRQSAQCRQSADTAK